MTDIIFPMILALMGVVWLLLDTASARDAARAHAGRYCRDVGVQLLDQTVALNRTRVVRKPGGAFWLERSFRFEFSESGNERCAGHITMLGRQAVRIVLEGERVGRLVAGSRSDEGG